jgi:N-acetylglucosaminyldiphosphoundecaprenol N-acetyl-beta-D-mannosaminyltransferase
MPLIWASRIQGTPLPERVTGSNLIWSLTASAARRRRSIYFLGGAPGTGQKASLILASRYPGLQVAGCSDIAFPSDLTADDQISRLKADLEATAPDIIYVALGSPKQEQLIERFRNTLPHSWWLGVGIAFSFVAGEIRRAPLWMQRAGLEWSHRLAQEPRRLARRYLVDGMPFAVRLLCGAVLMRFFG